MKTNAGNKHPSLVPSLPEGQGIIGVGIDIEEIQRFRGKSAAKDKLLRKIFTGKELAYCFSKKNAAQHLAARFAAKEAFYKALNGALPADFGFHDVEITHKRNGAPQITIRNKKIGDVTCLVSLSHNKEFATAIVLALRVS
jgi:holo-[acyl-carrier protein] synthase